MNGDVLIMERGAVERRAALIRAGAPARFWFSSAFGGPDWRRGRRVVGRVVEVNQALRAAFVDIGESIAGFLPLSKDEEGRLGEGQRILARIAAPPRQAKGARLSFDGAATPDAPLGFAPPDEAPAVEAARALLGEGGHVIADDPNDVSVLNDAGFTARASARGEGPALFRAFGADAALSDALARRLALAGGGALVFDETEALVAVDIDAGGIDAPSSDRLREKLALRAGPVVARQILLRNLAGRIVVDFPAIRTKTVRERVETRLREIFAALPGLSSFSVTRGGFVMLSVERAALSLWEQTSEATDDLPAPGRRFTLDWTAASALRETEWRHLARPGGRLSLRAGPALYECLAGRGCQEAFFARYGASVDLIRELSRDDRSFEIVESER